jgi:hypothetical protein
VKNQEKNREWFVVMLGMLFQGPGIFANMESVAMEK